MQPEIHPPEANVPAPAGDPLPAHPRKGIPRVTLILGVGLLAAVTFLAGIEAQKQWGGNSDSNGFGARAAAFRAAAGGNGTAGANGAPGGGFFRRGGGGVTTGKVKLVQGSTIFVTTTDGNTVKVSVPSSTAITKSVSTKLSGVHPGDNVTAIGTTSSDGVIKAVSVRLGDTGFPGFGGRRPGAQGAGAPPNTNGG
jgi:hypothetical protein